MADSDTDLEQQVIGGQPNNTRDGATERVKLDLSKYCTRDLVEQIMELISVKDALRRLGTATIVLELIVIIAVIALFYASTLSSIWWFAVCAYALVAGFIYGIVLGFLRIASRALGHIESILQLTLAIARNAVTDVADLHGGQARLPSGGELIEQVCDQVILPAIEEVVSGTLGFIGKPLLWGYRWTIGWTVRYVIKLVNRMSITKEQEAEVQTTVKSQLTDLAKYGESTSAYLESCRGVVGKAGRALRAYILRPLYMVFFMCLFFTFVPLIVVRYLLTGEAAG